MIENEQPQGRREITVFAVSIDVANQIRQRLPLAFGDIFQTIQNASSRLTLVLCPAMTIERLTTGDFIGFSCLDTVLI